MVCQFVPFHSFLRGLYGPFLFSRVVDRGTDSMSGLSGCATTSGPHALAGEAKATPNLNALPYVASPVRPSPIQFGKRRSLASSGNLLS